MSKTKRVFFESRASYILFNLFKNLNGGIVMLPANICPVVPATLLKAGVLFEFVDIERTTLSMDFNLILERIKISPTLYSGIIYVRTYGYTEFDAEIFFQEVKSLNEDILIVDDHCLSVPVFDPWETCADVLLFSTGYSKVAELGWGGYAFIDSEMDYIQYSINYESSAHDQLLDGFNRSITENRKIDYQDSDWLDGTAPIITFEDYKNQVNDNLKLALDHKNKINSIYTNLLPHELCLPEGFHKWRFNIEVRNKKEVLDKIFENRLFASSHYATTSVLFNDYEADISQNLSRQVINLFNDYRFSEESAESVAKIILKYAR